MKLSLIVAMSENRVIGVDNRLPWHIPEDLKRFKKITSGHPILMGRKTFESIGRVLPNRTNIIISRNREYRVEGAFVCHSLQEGIEFASKAPGSDEVFVIGGGEIFKEALPKADRIYLTTVHWPYEGDAFFPEIPAKKFEAKSSEKLSEDPAATLTVLERPAPVLGWQ